MKTTPTLFIALGGTGAEIALRLRRRILSHVWGGDNNPVHLNSLGDFPLAQFIYYDLDASSYLEMQRDKDSDPLADLVRFGDSERLTKKLDLNKYFKNSGEICKYPIIRDWFPIPHRKMLELNIDLNHGPDQIRAFSRLYFFDKYPELKNLIRTKTNYLLSNIRNERNIKHLGHQLDPGAIRVVVISSSSGGTGSGSFIDMGYLSKMLAEIELPNGNRKVDLYLMLQSGFSGNVKKRSQANTYAALMELETCMGQGNKFIKGWSENESPNLQRTPYDDVFLFDSGNLALRQKGNVTDLCDMVADTLFEDFIPSDFSNRKTGIRVCHTQYKVDSFHLPVNCMKYGSVKMIYSKAYSAFGHSVIETQTEQRLDNISSDEDICNPLITNLEGMDSSDRSSLFQNCIETAMPWVEASLDGIWTLNPDQYNCVIGVNGIELFEQKFGDELKSVVPIQSRMTPHHIRFAESGTPGKLTCYVELSGLPLTALTQLPNWREGYEEENKKIPVHIHKDRSLFVHPLAPSAATLDRLAEHFSLFIQGIVLGVLTQRRNDSGNLDYFISISGEEVSIGNERLIRLDGLSNPISDRLQVKVANCLEQLKSKAQHASLVTLYDYYVQCVYQPALVRNLCGMELLQESFPHVMCRKLGLEAQKTLEEKYPDEDTGMIVRLIGEDLLDNLETLDLWADEIEGSETDVYEYEVGRAHKPKRQLKCEFSQSGWLESQLGIVAGNSERKCCPACGELLIGAPNYCQECGVRQNSCEAILPPLRMG